MISSILFGLFGLSVLIGIAWVFSSNRGAVDWRLVLTGVGLQIGFAALVLLVPGGKDVFDEEEMRLLHELAGFAHRHVRRKAERYVHDGELRAMLDLRGRDAVAVGLEGGGEEMVAGQKQDHEFGRRLELLPVVLRAEGIDVQGPFARITLRIHSSLAAVGLTAAVSAALAQAGISANMVAGYHHDHILLAAADAVRALAVLEALRHG